MNSTTPMGILLRPDYKLSPFQKVFTYLNILFHLTHKSGLKSLRKSFKNRRSTTLSKKKRTQNFTSSSFFHLWIWLVSWRKSWFGTVAWGCECAGLIPLCWVRKKPKLLVVMWISGLWRCRWLWDDIWFTIVDMGLYGKFSVMVSLNDSFVLLLLLF